jgi:hypothetical protein
MTGKRKHAWGIFFGETGASRSSTASGSLGSSGPGAGLCELNVYLESDNVAAYREASSIIVAWVFL